MGDMPDDTTAVLRAARALNHCNSCGFLSTRGDAYRRVEGVKFCHSCADAYDVCREPVFSWVCAAIAAAEARAEEGER